MNSTDYERGLIGMAMSDGLHVVTQMLDMGITTDWFSDQSCATAFDGARSLFSKGAFINPITVSDEVKHCLPPEFLMQCLDEAPPYKVALDDYIEKLRLKMLHRAAMKLAQNVEHRIEETNTDQIEADIASIAGEWQSLTDTRQDERTLDQVGIQLVNNWETGEGGGYIEWPLPTLQSQIGSLSDEYVYIYSAPSVGKTALILQMILHNIVQPRSFRCDMLSLESKRDKVMQRLIAQHAKVNTWSLRRQIAPPAHYQRARDAAVAIGGMPLRVDDNGRTVEQAVAFAKAAKLKGSRWIVIDNMRHLRHTKRHNSPVEAHREASLALKWLKDDIAIPVVVLHHSNAEGMAAWSSDIERDADVMIRLAVDEEVSRPATEDNGWTEYCVVNIDVMKNREGKKNFSVRTVFEKEIQTFREMTKEEAR